MAPTIWILTKKENGGRTIFTKEKKKNGDLKNKKIIANKRWAYYKIELKLRPLRVGFQIEISRLFYVLFLNGFDEMMKQYNNLKKCYFFLFTILVLTAAF
uniref:Uncharacterized protein n=1 Tax=Cacopsylla melanoneura TaxID=428564 RepID=A0A8D8M079_9HEMI